MSKPNYTKVEEALQHYLEEQFQQKLVDTANTPAAEPSPQQELHHQLLVLQKNIAWLLKCDKELPQKLHIEKEQLLEYLRKKPSDISPEGWHRVKELYHACQKLKPEIEEAAGISITQKITKKLRRKESRKKTQFDVNKKWLLL